MHLTYEINWNGVFSEYPVICRNLCRWLNYDEDIDFEINEKSFVDFLDNKQVTRFPIILLSYFDKFMICHISSYSDWQPVNSIEMEYIKRYQSTVNTNIRGMVCFDYTDFDEAVNRTIMNCFELLNEIQN